MVWEDDSGYPLRTGRLGGGWGRPRAQLERDDCDPKDRLVLRAEVVLVGIGREEYGHWNSPRILELWVTFRVILFTWSFLFVYLFFNFACLLFLFSL
jgi:hypothetical protein